MAKDYYEVLGVPRSASVKEIRQAFRRLARKYHPDVNPGDKTSETKFKEINEAHEVLSDKESRRKYDQFGENWKHAGQFQDAGRGPYRRTTQAESDLWGDPRNFGSDAVFGRFFGGRSTRRQRRPPVEHPVEVTLEEAYTGATKLVEVTGLETCPVCKGAGLLQERLCVACGGSGTTTRTRRLEVKIPPGVDNGSKIKIPSPSGADILLKVSLKSHKGFERKGKNLNSYLSVPLYETVLGGEIEVSTLKGKVVLKVPPETQNGRTFRLQGQGMPSLKSGETKGDLYVTVQVLLPADLSDEEKHLFEDLKALRKNGVDGHD